jgi:hypothetical protein
MASVPTEILDMIVKFVDPSDIGNFRLCCWRFAEIGLPYLLPEAVVYLQPASLFKLARISQYPGLSKAIRSLHFEINGLKEPAMSFEEYIAEVRRVQQAFAGITLGLPLDSIRTRRLTRLEFESSYGIYAEMVRIQHLLLKTRLHHQIWDAVLTKFHNLESITIASGYAFYPKRHTEGPYYRHCVTYGYDVSDPLGLSDFNFLLKAAAKAGTKLKKRRVGLISWKFFVEMTDETLNTLLQPLSQLTTLKLNMSTGVDGETDEVGLEAEECSEFMQEGGLRRFIASLPTLQTLVVDFDFRDEEFNYGASFEDIFDQTGEWPQLRKLTLATIRINQADFLSFARKHKGSLKRLHLMNIHLDKSWLPFLHEIQSTLDLEEGHVYGDIYGESREEDGWIGEEWHLNWLPDDDPLRDRLSKFLVEGGECPLELDNMECYM